MGDKVTGMVGNEDLGHDINVRGDMIHFKKRNINTMQDYWDKKAPVTVSPIEKSVVYGPYSSLSQQQFLSKNMYYG